MRAFLLPLLALAVGGAPLAAQVRPGTYSLRICKAEPCRPADAVATGVLVLLPDTLHDAQIPDSVRWTFYDGSLRLEDGGHRNGCLSMHDSRQKPEFARWARGCVRDVGPKGRDPAAVCRGSTPLQTVVSSATEPQPDPASAGARPKP